MGIKKETTKKSCSKKTRRPMLIISLCTLLAVVLAVGGAFSLYLGQEKKYGEINTSRFYFESDYLVEGGQTLPVYTDVATFSLYNHENWGTPSTETISYTLTATRERDGVRYPLELDETRTVSDVPENVDVVPDNKIVFTPSKNEETGNLVEGDNGSSLFSWERVDSFSISGEFGDKVTVTAKSSSPYIKELKCTFEFENPDRGSWYRVVDNGYYCVLKLFIGETTTSYNIVAELPINFGDLIQDTASLGIDNEPVFDESGHKMTVKVTANSYFELIFFDESNNDYTTPDAIKLEIDDEYGHLFKEITLAPQTN